VSLRRLDLGNNRIRRWDEVQRLALLPQLEKLWLEGNPVADIAAYRIKARGRLFCGCMVYAFVSLFLGSRKRADLGYALG
jgi:Leucine-rich repeat (LRR) protein